MPNKTNDFLASLIAKFQAKMLAVTGWALVRDNPCRDRHASLAQEGYFETFDYIRLAQLELIASHIRQFSIPGDCAELGVFRGFFAQKIHDFLPDRKLILFDTFEGFDNRDISIESAISSESARDAFHRTSCESVLSLFKDPKQVEIRKGYFPETARSTDGPFCFVSLDVDLYKPTLEGLKFFYDKMTPGGIILVNDYNNSRYPAVAKAVQEFFPTGKEFVPIPDKNGSALVFKP